MVKISFQYKLDTGTEIEVEAEIDLGPDKLPYVWWDSWKFDGREVLDTDSVSDDDKTQIHQQIMDEYETVIAIQNHL